MANECIPLFEPGDRLTADASSAITGKRFCMISANVEGGPGLSTNVTGNNLRAAHASAGALALGVASHDCAQDDKVTLITGGVVPVTADGAISAGNEVEVGTAGKAKAKTAGGQSVGIAVANATDGNDCYVFLLAGTSPGAPGSGNEYAQGTQQAFIADPSDPAALTAAATFTKTAVAPAAMTATDTEPIVAAAGEPTAADLTLTQALQVDFDALVVDVTAIHTQVVAAVADLATLDTQYDATQTDIAALRTAVVATNNKIDAILDVLIEYGMIAAS